MADNRTMAQMLQAPIEGYEDAIVIPPINANNFELKQPLINLVQSNKFTGRQDPHNHLRFFNKVIIIASDAWRAFESRGYQNFKGQHKEPEEQSPEEDDDEDPKEDLADGGDDVDDEDDSSYDDEDEDVDIKGDEEEEEHPAPADSIAVALPAVDHASSAEETKPFETNEDETPISLPPREEVERTSIAYGLTPPLSKLTPSDIQHSAATQIRDEMLVDMPGAPATDNTELGQRMTEFTTRVRQDIDKIYTRLDDEQSERQLMAGWLNMLYRDRRAHAQVLMIDCLSIVETDKVIHIVEIDIVKLVVEIKSFGMSADEFDKETGSSDGLQPKQADLSCVHALNELHLHEIHVVPSTHEVDQC
ncbi:hypothetical protein Tco_0641682 [Tanacetum coccineum]